MKGKLSQVGRLTSGANNAGNFKFLLSTARIRDSSEERSLQAVSPTDSCDFCEGFTESVTHRRNRELKSEDLGAFDRLPRLSDAIEFFVIGRIFTVWPNYP